MYLEVITKPDARECGQESESRLYMKFGGGEGVREEYVKVGS